MSPPPPTTPLTLSIGNVHGLSVPIVPRGTPIPSAIPYAATRALACTTGCDYQRGVRVGLYQGERARVGDNLFVGEVELAGFPPEIQGSVTITVEVEVGEGDFMSIEVNAGGVSTVKVFREENHNFVPVSKARVAEMLQDAETHRAEDEGLRNRSQRNSEVVELPPFELDTEEQPPSTEDLLQTFHRAYEEVTRHYKETRDKSHESGAPVEFVEGSFYEDMFLSWVDSLHTYSDTVDQLHQAYLGVDMSRIYKVDNERVRWKSLSRALNITFPPLMNMLNKAGLKSLGPEVEQKTRDHLQSSLYTFGRFVAYSEDNLAADNGELMRGLFEPSDILRKLDVSSSEMTLILTLATLRHDVEGVAKVIKRVGCLYNFVINGRISRCYAIPNRLPDGRCY